MAATNVAAVPSLIIEKIRRCCFLTGRAVLLFLAAARFVLVRLGAARFPRVLFALARGAVTRFAGARFFLVRLTEARLAVARFALTRLAAAFFEGFLRRIFGMRNPEGSHKDPLNFIKIQ